MKDLMNMNANQEPTMSSREIAELCEKQHKHVLADIRKMLIELNIQSAEFSADYQDDKNRTYKCFNLPRRECDILIAGYSIKYRAKIVDRWRELEAKEAKPAFQIPTTLSEALLLAGEIEKERERLEVENLEQKEQLTIAAPKVNHYDTVVERTNLVNATQVGSKIKMSARKLNEHLSQMDVYNKNVTRSKVFKKWFTDEGYGEVKQTMDGYTQSLFTMKGEAWVIEQLTSEGII